MRLDKSQAIRLAEKLANETGRVHHVVKVCLPRGYDIMTDENFQDSEAKSVYKAFPDDIRVPDMELTPGAADG